MDTSKLQVGQTFKNWKELCEYVGEKPKSGGKGQALQKLQFRKYFEYDFARYKIQILNVLDEPLPYKRKYKIDCPKNIMGIYKILNIITGKIYVGSSKNIYNRWIQHVWNMENGKHPNKDMQKDCDEYTLDSFTFSIIKEVLDQEKLLEEEQREYDKLCTTNEMYNSKSPIREADDKYKTTLSNAHIGKKVLEMYANGCTPQEIYDIIGKIKRRIK